MSKATHAVELTVEQAREQSVCRICKKTISAAGMPVDWHTRFMIRIYPSPRVVLNAGTEFAHETCLKKEKSS